MDAKRRSHSQSQSHHSSSSMPLPLPLVSRLDHLDFIMKYLERKQNVAKLGDSSSEATTRVMKRECVPATVDLALKETYFKGSLLDRVAALEHRLSQLYLGMAESGSSSSTNCTSSHTSWSSHASKGESSRSSTFPTFNVNPNLRHKPPTQLHEVANRLQIDEEQPEKEHSKEKPATTCPAQQQLRKKKKMKNRTKNDENSCKNERKKISSNWPYLKLLGC